MTATVEEEEKARCHRRVVQQFIKEKKSEDAFSFECKNNDCTKKPCLCEFRAYEKQAHKYLLCDICRKVPIGCVYMCFECTSEAPYIVCSRCDNEFIHPCKVPMFALDTPLSLEALDNFVANVRLQRQVTNDTKVASNQYLLHPLFNWILKNAFTRSSAVADHRDQSAAFSF